MIAVLIQFLLVCIFIGTLPILVLLLQYVIAGFHGVRNHYSKCKDYTPRVSILIPSWNEGDVIGFTLDHLMELDYPKSNLHIYVIDDGSSDNTPVIVKEKMALFPDNIFYLRREVGGLGKSHTLNSGLKTVLADDWTEAIMITDADIIFEPNVLRQMAMHLADPKVGAVTAYIKVSQASDNFLTHCIASEYILSQAITRRAQNVLGALACLAGGAQLHTRENIMLIGGEINTSTLAEDTYTTFLTQINHKRAIFEGNAFVLAEEPDNLPAFWKQRFRWSRGNVQITAAFRNIWFRFRHHSKLGGIFFGMAWFSTIGMPFAMIMTSISLIILFFIDPTRAWTFFKLFYIISAVSYIFSTLLSFSIDMKTMHKAWFSSLMFPGLISLCMMLLVFAPAPIRDYLARTDNYQIFTWQDGLLLFMDAWISICMFFAWVIYRLAKLGMPKWLVHTLLIIVGYGPLLCVITLLAFFAELRKSTIIWEKTEKKIKHRKETKKAISLSFKDMLKKDKRAERKLVFDEVLIILFMAVLFTIPLAVHYYK